MAKKVTKNSGNKKWSSSKTKSATTPVTKKKGNKKTRK